MPNQVNKTEKQWREQLTPQQYHILREKGTERPYSGKHIDNKKAGIFSCAACGTGLFSSESKYDSKSGWPSFYDVIDKKNIKLKDDYTLLMHRLEVQCVNCGGHLGHLFHDGPRDKTGMRFCINSAALDFKKSSPK